MQSNTAALLAGLSNLTRQAREVDWREVDASNAVFLAQLGQCDALASQGTITPDAADRQQRDLIEKRRTQMESMIAAGVNWQYRQTAPTPELPPHQRAAALLEQVQAAGVQIVAHRDGALSISPASKLPAGLREVITGLREHIVAALSRDVILIPAQKRGAAA